MSSSDHNDTIIVTFNPLFPWMLMIFSGICICLGILFMMPFMAGQNVLLGIGIVIAAVAGIVGGRFWLRHLPVMLRLTPEGLQIARKKTTYRWTDIDHVDVKTIYVKGQVRYLCIRLKAESKARCNVQPDGLIARAIKAIGGDFDLVFNDQEFSIPAELLKAEIEKRLASV